MPVFQPGLWKLHLMTEVQGKMKDLGEPIFVIFILIHF